MCSPILDLLFGILVEIIDTMKILVTAGGTREYIDPVRFISNASTGKMGYAIAAAAAAAGHEVTMISAPTWLEKPLNVKTIDVVTSNDMYEAVKSLFNDVDCLIMAAAVSDYRPAATSTKKIKKHQSNLNIILEPTTDIIRWAGENKKSQIIVGFALEDTDLLTNAEAKMKAKNMDMIVANTPAAISADTSRVHIKVRGKDWVSMAETNKSQTAKSIIAMIEAI